MTQNTNPHKKLSAIFKNSKEKITHQTKRFVEKIISVISDDKKESFIGQLLQDTKNKKDYFNNSFISNLLKTLTSAKLNTSNIIKLIASDGKPDNRFGWSVAVSNSKIVVGVPNDSDYDTDAGCVYIYDLDGTNEIKLTPSNQASRNYFGWSVAVSDTKIAVGAYGNRIKGSYAGCAYIYDLDGSNEIILTASDGTADDFFGCSVAISNSKIVIGAHGSDVNGTDSGCAYIYDLDGSNEVKLIPSDGVSYNNFGFSAAISNSKIVIGAYSSDVNGADSGCAYIYDLDGSNEIKLLASDGTFDNYFGFSVAISNSKIVIGVPYDKTNGTDSGCAYIYDLDGSNEIKITPSDGVADDYFGISVAVSDTKIVVGATHNDNHGHDVGCIYVYDLDGSNEIKLIASNGAAGDYFGISVAVSDTKIAVGAPYDNTQGPNSGSVYIYN